MSAEAGLEIVTVLLPPALQQLLEAEAARRGLACDAVLVEAVREWIMAGRPGADLPLPHGVEAAYAAAGPAHIAAEGRGYCRAIIHWAARRGIPGYQAPGLGGTSSPRCGLS